MVALLWDSPGFKAGLTTGAQITAVNSVSYTGELLKQAITTAKTGEPVEVLVKVGDRVKTIRFDYRGGLRYPRLTRAGNTPARLDQIFSAKP